MLAFAFLSKPHIVPGTFALKAKENSPLFQVWKIKHIVMKDSLLPWARFKKWPKIKFVQNLNSKTETLKIQLTSNYPEET